MHARTIGSTQHQQAHEHTPETPGAEAPAQPLLARAIDAIVTVCAARARVLLTFAGCVQRGRRPPPRCPSAMPSAMAAGRWRCAAAWCVATPGALSWLRRDAAPQRRHRKAGGARPGCAPTHAPSPCNRAWPLWCVQLGVTGTDPGMVCSNRCCVPSLLSSVRVCAAGAR